MLRIIGTIKTIKRKKLIAAVFHLCSLSSFLTLTCRDPDPRDRDLGQIKSETSLCIVTQVTGVSDIIRFFILASL
jgi:hypothetical protein